MVSTYFVGGHLCIPDLVLGAATVTSSRPRLWPPATSRVRRSSGSLSRMAAALRTDITALLHAPPEGHAGGFSVVRAAELGIMCGYETEHQTRLAERIAEVISSAELVRFAGSGTETTQPAASNSRTAANPTDGRNRSTRQVTNNATRG